MGTPAGIPSGTVTFAFTDVEDSTVLMRRLGARYEPLLRRHNEIIRGVADAARGYVVKSEGDGFFLAFDSAERAVRACIEAQLLLAKEKWPDDGEFRVRMGLHAGHAMPDDEGDYVAIAVHQAARVAAAAHGGQVLASDTVRALVDEAAHFRFEDLGRFRLKGFEGSRPLYQVVHTGLAAAFPPPRAAPAAARNLPRVRTTFIGRVDELRKVEKLLEESDLLTLVGPGGAGKTRLAVEAAYRVANGYADGAWFVDLSTVDANGVVGAVAAAIGLRAAGAESTAAEVAEHLGGAAALLVLDNCEHVVDAAAEVAAALVDECPNLKVLATSREPLRVSGEAVFPVPPLGLERSSVDLGESDATALFVDRATGLDPSFVADGAIADAVADIVAKLDGLPLAIELAAARVATVGVPALAARLDRSLDAVAIGPRSSAPRQRTLRSLIGWSHDLLSATERAAFRRLGIFSGGFTLDAAAAVIADPSLRADDIFDIVHSLVDKSLLVVSGDALRRRFRMLDTIHAYACEQLELENEQDAMQRAHASWALSLAQEGSEQLLGPGQGAWVECLDDELANLRAALSFSSANDPSTYVALTLALARFWLFRDYSAEGRWHVSETLDRTSDEPTRAKLLAAGARLALADSSYDQAMAMAKESESIALAIDDQLTRTLALQAQGESAYRAGRFDEARRAFRASLELAGDDDSLVAVGLSGLGGIARDDGEFTEAKALLEDALARARRVGQPTLVATSCGPLGELLLYEGDGHAARQLFEAELTAARAAGNRHLVAFALGDLANAANVLGEYSAALDLWRDALDVAASTSNRQGMARAHTGIGAAALYMKSPTLAREHLEIASALALEVSQTVLAAQCHYFLALAADQEDDVERTYQQLATGLKVLGDDGAKAVAENLVSALSELLVLMGEHRRAARAMGCLGALRRRDSPDDSASQASALVEALGREAFEQEWRRGHSGSLSDLLAPLGTN